MPTKNPEANKLVEETYAKLKPTFRKGTEESFVIFVSALGKKVIDSNPEKRKAVRKGLKEARAKLKKYEPRTVTKVKKQQQSRAPVTT